jgi:hypothetical protein
MLILPFFAGYIGLWRAKLGTDQRNFASGKTRSEVITKLLTNAGPDY